jgi:hypothetical protein
MKTMQLICAGSALAWLLASSVSAHAGVTVTPPAPNGQPLAFTASGPTLLGKGALSVGCETVLTGTISSTGDLKITGASMRGAGVCNAISAEFPAETSVWSGNIENAKSLALDNVSVNVNIPLVGGKCGPTNIKAALSNDPAKKEMVITFSNQLLSGGCSISGSLTTTPYLNVTD